MTRPSAPTTSRTKPRTDRAAGKETTKPAPEAKEPKKHTALVYFHGMGEQRRYEEVSRLVDALDQFSQKAELPGPYKIKLKMEPSRSDAARPLGYIQALYNDPPRNTWRQEFRFYECYYANLAAGGVRPLEVLRWILSLTSIPRRMLFVPWRELERLRQATLLAAWGRLVQKRRDLTEDDRTELLEAHDRFERWDARRDFPNGRFANFHTFLANDLKKKKNIGDPAVLERVQWLASEWRWLFVKEQLVNGFFVLVFLATLGLLLFALATIVWQVATGAWLAWIPRLFRLEALPALLRYGSLALVLYGLYLVIRALLGFLRDFVGDIAFWTSYQETAERHKIRRAILDCSAELLSQVLLNPECERVVLVGHSLGTTIAHDTILELARRNWASNPSGGGRGDIPLEKIQHMVTMGSPIDKVHYLFESGTSQYHRYNRITRELRGDMSRFPFADGKQPYLHWINFWDQADLASGPLETPTNFLSPHIQVDNCEVTGTALPEPARAHSQYLDNPVVAGILYQILFNDQFNFVKRFKQERRFCEEDLVRPQGGGRRSTRGMQALIVLVIWLVLASSLFTRTQIPILNQAFGVSLLAICALVLMFRFVNWARSLAG